MTRIEIAYKKSINDLYRKNQGPMRKQEDKIDQIRL